MEFLDQFLKPDWVGTNKITDLSSVFEYQECRHRTDANLLRDVCLLVDVDLVELDAGILSRELFKDRRDDSARATPRRPEVDGDEFARVDYLLELIERFDFSDRHLDYNVRGVWVNNLL